MKAIACRYCGLSPTYCTCDRFLDARLALFHFSTFELFQTRKTRKGLPGASSEAPASAPSTAARSRVSRAQERTGGCFL